MINITSLLAAIAIIETGDLRHPEGNDRAIGRSGEVSRYQIMPAVWRRKAVQSWSPRVHDHAEYVAACHIIDIRYSLSPARRDSPYIIACVWNGGPRAAKHPGRATREYANRVAAVYLLIEFRQKTTTNQKAT